MGDCTHIFANYAIDILYSVNRQVRYTLTNCGKPKKADEEVVKVFLHKVSTKQSLYLGMFYYWQAATHHNEVSRAIDCLS